MIPLNNFLLSYYKERERFSTFKIANGLGIEKKVPPETDLRRDYEIVTTYSRLDISEPYSGITEIAHFSVNTYLAGYHSSA